MQEDLENIKHTMLNNGYLQALS